MCMAGGHQKMFVTPPFLENSRAQKMQRQYQSWSMTKLGGDCVVTCVRGCTKHVEWRGFLQCTFKCEYDATVEWTDHGAFATVQSQAKWKSTNACTRSQQSKEMPSALKQSVDILGKQNNYPTSIVSAQRQILQHDFYSERSTSYACIVPIPQTHVYTHAHASASLHTKWTSKQAKGTRARRRTRKKSNIGHLDSRS